MASGVPCGQAPSATRGPIPSLNEMIRLVAGFGGFLNRKGDGFPGPQTLWIGLQRTRDFVLALEAQRAMQNSSYG